MNTVVIEYGYGHRDGYMYGKATVFTKAAAIVMATATETDMLMSMTTATTAPTAMVMAMANAEANTMAPSKAMMDMTTCHLIRGYGDIFG